MQTICRCHLSEQLSILGWLFVTTLYYNLSLPYRVNVFQHFLRNICPVVGQFATPWEMFKGSKPDVSKFKVFGATAYIHQHPSKRKKLDPKSMKEVFVGYAGPNYRILGEDGKVHVSHDVIVHEVPLPKQIESKEVQNVPLISFGSSDSENPDDVPGLLPTEISENEGASKLSDSSSNKESDGVGRQEEQSKSQTAPGWRSSRVNKVPDRLCASVNAELESVLVPKSYEEAMASIHSVQWLQAMKDELKSHEEHETWVLEVKPENLKTVKSK
jgi:hypothetical protein